MSDRLNEPLSRLYIGNYSDHRDRPRGFPHDVPAETITLQRKLLGLDEMGSFINFRMKLPQGLYQVKQPVCLTGPDSHAGWSYHRQDLNSLEDFYKAWNTPNSWGGVERKMAMLPAGCFFITLGKHQVIGEIYDAHQVLVGECTLAWLIVDRRYTRADVINKL